MKYLFSDFYFLSGAAEKNADTVGDAYRYMTAEMVSPVSMPCLLHAIRGLVAGGYITVPPNGGCITASTPLSVTEAGRRAVAILPLRRIFGGELKASRKNELAFCSLDRPEATVGEDWVCEVEGFAEITEDMMRRGNISSSLFELTEIEDELLKLTVHHPNDGYTDGDEDTPEEPDPDASETADSVSVTGRAETILQGFSDLFTTAHALMTEPPRTRKVALHGADKSLVITLAQAAGDHGTILRMTVAQIRFNRQRFIGKRDSDLDYAQCGDPIMTLELSANADAFATLLLPSAAALPERLNGELGEMVNELHKRIQR